MSSSLAVLVDRMEAEGPIDPASVDFTVNHPDVVNGLAGYAIAFGEAVEIEVPTTAEIVRTILPNMSESKARFVDIWDLQETQHGVLLGGLREAVGAPPLPTRSTVPAVMKFLGMLSKVTPGMHDIVDAVYLIEGALGEKETFIFYNQLRKKLNGEGEEEPLGNILGKIASQEAIHLAYYIQSSLEISEALSPWQTSFVRELVERSYTPVGVRISKRDVERRRQFGHTALIMTEDVGVQRYTDPVEQLFRYLTGIVDDNPNPFLRKRYEECIEAYSESIAA